MAWSCLGGVPGPEAGSWGTSGPAAAGAGRRPPGPAGQSRGGCRYWTSSHTPGGHTTPGAGVQKVASAATSPATRAEMVTSLVVERGKLGHHKQGSSHDTYPLNPSLVAFCTPKEIV